MHIHLPLILQMHMCILNTVLMMWVCVCGWSSLYRWFNGWLDGWVDTDGGWMCKQINESMDG